MLRLILSGAGEEDYIRCCEHCNREEEDPDPNFFTVWYRDAEAYKDFCSPFCHYKWLEDDIRLRLVK